MIKTLAIVTTFLLIAFLGFTVGAIAGVYGAVIGLLIDAGLLLLIMIGLFIASRYH